MAQNQPACAKSYFNSLLRSASSPWLIIQNKIMFIYISVRESIAPRWIANVFYLISLWCSSEMRGHSLRKEKCARLKLTNSFDCKNRQTKFAISDTSGQSQWEKLVLKVKYSISIALIYTIFRTVSFNNYQMLCVLKNKFCKI